MPPRTTYLNAASHGLPDEAVLERMLAHIRRESEVGPVIAVREAADEIASVRQKAADLISADATQIAFTQTTMSGWSSVVSVLPLKGRRILVAPDEWGECAQTLTRLGNPLGMRLEVMPTTQDGAIDIAALKASLDDDVAAISMPMVSSLRGTRNPVEDVGALPRPDHSFFIVDGAQALGQLPVDVRKINCDIFAATARKWLRSSRGTAILYVRPSALERMAQVSVLDAPGTPSDNEHSDVRQFESFDYVVALRLALGVAIDVLNANGLASVGDTIRTHARHVRDRLARAGLQLASPADPQSGITSFYLPGDAADGISQHLASQDVIVKFPPASDEPMRTASSDGAVLMRVSPHIYNDPGEIDALFDHIDARV